MRPIFLSLSGLVSWALIFFDPNVHALNTQLAVKLVQNKSISIIVSPDGDASSCTYLILGSTSKKRLSNATPKGTSLASFTGEDNVTSLSASNLKKIRPARGSHLKTQPIYFIVQTACGADITNSNLVKIPVKLSKSNSVRSVKAWLADFGKKVGPADLSLTDAFPTISAFTHPLDLQNAGDGSGRLFVVEQGGKIFVITNPSTSPVKTEFLNLSAAITQNDDLGERGLLGLAFHPKFSTNGFFYVNYTAAGDDHTVVARYHVNNTTPNQADPSSALILLEQSQPFINHNGGSLAFGKDGFLYIGFGDGGSGGDPEGNGQKKSTFLGKILRIDVDHPSAGKQYSIPSGNPFVGNGSGFKEEIFAFGLRNPWRISFDSVTGKLWAADVGQGEIEEIDIIENGKNYGWNIMEGSKCYPPGSSCSATGLTLPITEYTHSLGQSVTGGYVYRGSAIPALSGKYIYGDFGSGRIWSLSYDGATAFVSQLFDTEFNISSFGIDQSNELFVVSYGDGKIYALRRS